MKILLVCFVFTFFLINCTAKAQKKCDISVLNKSSVIIDRVKISTYGVNTILSNIIPNNKIEKSIHFQDTGQYEGAFLIEIYIGDSIKRQATFGYYSNSSEIKPNYWIEILNDFTIKEVGHH